MYLPAQNVSHGKSCVLVHVFAALAVWAALVTSGHRPGDSRVGGIG